MTEGSIVLTAIPQADGRLKNRPALVLRQLPPFSDLLLCGISTQLHQQVAQFDEVVSTIDTDFSTSGLRSESLIRLGFLSVLPASKIIGTIGSITPVRQKRLLQNLADYLVK